MELMWESVITRKLLEPLKILAFVYKNWCLLGDEEAEGSRTLPSAWRNHKLVGARVVCIQQLAIPVRILESCSHSNSTDNFIGAS